MSVSEMLAAGNVPWDKKRTVSACRDCPQGQGSWDMYWVNAFGIRTPVQRLSPGTGAETVYPSGA